MKIIAPILILLTILISSCNQDDLENAQQNLSTQDSIQQKLSELQGTWYLYRKKRAESWYNCDGLYSGAYTENFTTNLLFSDFKFIFTSQNVNVGLGSLQFNFLNFPHSNYFRLQVNGYDDYYALSKEGNNFMLYNNLNNAGWSYYMGGDLGGKYGLHIYGDTLMLLYGTGGNLFMFKKEAVSENPENIVGLNGNYKLTSQEDVSSGVVSNVWNYSDGYVLSFTNEVGVPDAASYAYVPGSYKGVWYKAFINFNTTGPILQSTYCFPNGSNSIFYYSTSEKFSENNGNFIDVGEAQYEIVINDGTNLLLRKGGVCTYTQWHFIKVN